MQLINLLPTYTKQESQNFSYTFTVFTPVYNRADTLERVFKSLNAQTFKDFELVMINDGSKDNSHEVALELIKTATFPVNYINNTNNKHKMACFMQAIQVAKGTFILPFDSDDECTADALQVFKDEYDAIPKEKKENISGVTCLCNDQFGNLVGEPFKESPYYSNTFKQQMLQPNASEKWGFTKTEILKNIQVNDRIFSRGYIPEGVIWELIAKQGFETKYINTTLRTYYLDTENAISIQNHKKDAFGMAIYSLSILNWYYKDYIFKKPTLFIKRIYTLLRASQYLEFNLKDYQQAIKSKLLRFCFTIGWPLKKLF
ncbi:glycosyltransferase family 2 protein [Oceanihabitans sp. 2_MG-2023]|uniref:glycosyltransferase family 2 protein n=1 Tax=Oceanihabitans sp. 2_MG-2023 TaxID=3062661 RepID=UPI0026E2D88E|nr:glycosyltransferase family 2 protein [Oceanihabitans sp. 2_MG-2023]MDO6596770.1 glycosyltransferase family 2 protein [Oceanihabitans sp. 2_MG-2023]